MPFIAIALAISLFLGGSAAVAASPVGHAAITHLSGAFAHVEATFTGNTDTEEDDTAPQQENQTALDAHTDATLQINSF